MKNIALEKLRTGSCEVTNAASRYRLRRNCKVVGPPRGSDSVKPAEALAPIITIRAQGALVLVGTAGFSDLDGFCESAAQTETVIKLKRRTKRGTLPRNLISVSGFRLGFFRCEADSMPL